MTHACTYTHTPPLWLPNMLGAAIIQMSTVCCNLWKWSGHCYDWWRLTTVQGQLVLGYAKGWKQSQGGQLGRTFPEGFFFSFFKSHTSCTRRGFLGSRPWRQCSSSLPPSCWVSSGSPCSGWTGWGWRPASSSGSTCQSSSPEERERGEMSHGVRVASTTVNAVSYCIRAVMINIAGR